jgi:hypothetical protein
LAWRLFESSRLRWPTFRALDVDGHGIPVVLVVRFWPELRLAHELVALFTLATADLIERGLIVALADDVHDVSPRELDWFKPRGGALVGPALEPAHPRTPA